MSSILKKVKERSQQFGTVWGEKMIRYRWLVILLAVTSVMGLAAGATNLGFDSDYRVFFKKDNPQLMAYEALQKKYTQDDNVLLVIEPTDNEVFNASTLEAIEQLTENSWQVPYSSRVDAITNFQHTYAEGDDLFVEDLVEGANSKTASEIQKIEAIAKREPLLVHRLLNEKRYGSSGKYYSEITG